MDILLSGERAFVTGLNRDIGLAAACVLAAENASVSVNGRSSTRVAEAIEGLRGMVPEALVQGSVAELGAADTRVNHLGILERVAFSDIDDRE
jgi:NAD(P)-dependent dehydrogenase (short-subunit alcohol dehydrogenase family)